ncbi:MAG: hypothetical protein QME49_08015 [bacterium]|nr:hypothetical protein [bacterium]
MTKLFHEAVTTVSTRLNHQDQDRLAYLIIENVGKLPKLLEDMLDEQSFDASAVKAIESETVQHLLKRVAGKHQMQYSGLM